MSKYRRLRQSVVDNPLHDGDIMLVPAAATLEQLCLAHDKEYVERVVAGELSDAEIKRIGFPWSERMVERSRRSSGATLSAARIALQEGVSANLAGGTHHAMRGTGEGYCVFNDAAVAIRTLIHEGAIRNAAVIDCDVHQGNGTADILGSDPNVFTFSIHGEKNFPLRKMASHLDIDLPDGTSDDDYLSVLATGIQTTLEAGPYDLVIYLAGADPYEGDRLGRLNLTKEGLRRRDAMVLDALRARQTPVAIAMAGGYAPDIQDIVDIHSATLLIASQMQRDWPTRLSTSTKL
jgi:acetoin utilization deacetylase AcuC-like enzyme